MLGEKPVPVSLFPSHVLHEVAPSNQGLRSERRVVILYECRRGIKFGTHKEGSLCPLERPAGDSV